MAEWSVTRLVSWGLVLAVFVVVALPTKSPRRARGGVVALAGAHVDSAAESRAQEAGAVVGSRAGQAVGDAMPSGSCPAGSVRVHGKRCEEPVSWCLEWIDGPEAGAARRCRRYAPTRCKGKRIPMDFCIDEDEHASASGLPDVHVTFDDASRTCEGEGKRLCRESEWTFACEGGSALPYPTGLERPSFPVCNEDRMQLFDEKHHILDLRMTSSDLTSCVSPFGVRNMTGNVDEWTVRDLTWGPYKSALKGGWWMPGRNRCRPATVAHNEQYADFQVGFRCCADTHP